MGIYQKILASKVCFPEFINEGANALVKKLLTADLIKRSATGGSAQISCCGQVALRGHPGSLSSG